MLGKLCISLVLFSCVHLNDGTVHHVSKEMEAYSRAYYDLKTGRPLKGRIESSSRSPFTKIGFRGLPCACKDMSCGCCAGINLTAINFDRKACTNFTYDPYEFEIRMQITMNDNSIFNKGISARNPPPICLPMPYIPAIDFCVRFYNIFMPGNNFHACMDFETRVVQSPIMVLHFDCMRLGVDGLAWIKPEDNGGLDKPEVASSGSQAGDIYDEVNFEPNDFEASSNDNTTLSPEDEDKIGQLKL